MVPITLRTAQKARRLDDLPGQTGQAGRLPPRFLSFKFKG